MLFLYAGPTVAGEECHRAFSKGHVPLRTASMAGGILPGGNGPAGNRGSRPSGSPAAPAAPPRGNGQAPWGRGGTVNQQRRRIDFELLLIKIYFLFHIFLPT